MNLFLFIAIISPFIFGFMNVFDKYIVAHRVKYTFAYTLVAGIVNVLLGLILILFLSWNNLSHSELIFPILAGIFSGIAYYFYFYIMKDSDASYMVGFLYLYPIVVAILSFIFLHERLTILSYISVAIIILGVVLLSIRAKKIKASFLLVPLIFYVLTLGGYEFFIKLSTNNMSFLQGLAITTFVSGLTVLCGAVKKEVRKGFSYEIKNLKWAICGEGITMIAVLTLYFAMSGLSATVVASIASTQPLAIILFERVAHSYFGKMTKDVKLLPKLGAILLIVVGVILLILSGS